MCSDEIACGMWTGPEPALNDMLDLSYSSKSELLITWYPPFTNSVESQGHISLHMGTLTSSFQNLLSSAFVASSLQIYVATFLNRTPAR